MALKRRPKRVAEHLRPVRINLDDLREIEAALLAHHEEIEIETGRYQATRVDDLAGARECTASRVTIGVKRGLHVSMDPWGTLVHCVRPTADDREAAHQIEELLKPKQRRVYFGIINGAPRLAAFLGIFTLILGSGLLFAIWEAKYPETRMFTASIYLVFLLSAFLAFANLYRRIPIPPPLVIHPDRLREQNPVRRNAGELSLALAALTLIVTIAVAVFG